MMYTKEQLEAIEKVKLVFSDYLKKQQNTGTALVR